MIGQPAIGGRTEDGSGAQVWTCVTWRWTEDQGADADLEPGQVQKANKNIAHPILGAVQ